ncbi:MAG: ATP-grasp domain-containing protein [Firmicutes bacterium]|nr:ATP-grasp domain-containing protein [Bacillota bacterium]
MKKIVIFIESNTTGTGMLALKKAKELGYIPILITNNPNRYRGLRETQCEVLICNTNSLDVLIEFIESRFSVKDIVGITTTSDFYVEVVSNLASKYNLIGNPSEAIKLCRDKSKTRDILTKNGILQPKYTIINRKDTMDEAIKLIGLPCIIKPAEDSGSNNVRFCSSNQEAKSLVEKILDNDVNGREQKIIPKVLVEEYLDYPEYSVEMFNWNNESICIGITEKKLIGFPYFVEYRHIFPAKLRVELQEEIVTTVSKALKILGIKYGPTHTEVKLTPSGCAIIEVNARLAGGMIPELIYHVTNNDMLESQIKTSIGIAPNFNETCHGYAGIQFLVTDKKGILNNISGVEEASMMEGIKQVSLTCENGRAVSNPQNAFDRLGFIIATGKNYDDVEKNLQNAVNRINISIS